MAKFVATIHKTAIYLVEIEAGSQAEAEKKADEIADGDKADEIGNLDSVSSTVMDVSPRDDAEDDDDE